MSTSSNRLDATLHARRAVVLSRRNSCKGIRQATCYGRRRRAAKRLRSSQCRLIETPALLAVAAAHWSRMRLRLLFSSPPRLRNGAANASLDDRPSKFHRQREARLNQWTVKDQWRNQSCATCQRSSYIKTMLPVLVAILVSAFSSDSPPDHPWDLPALHAQKSATDPCAPVNPCLYNATCTVNNERYRLTPYLCACPVGYSGTTCEIQSLIAVAFSSNMVLQASSPHTTLYGAANATTPGDLITITIHFNTKAASKSKSYHATATMNGSWSVVLGTLAPSTDPATVIIFSEHTHVSQTLTNVLVGDVFVCSGQSNMALPVGSASLPLNSSQTEDLARNYPHIRLLNNGHFWPPTPSHPGGTALGQQTGDAPGWHEPSFGNGSHSRAPRGSPP